MARPKDPSSSYKVHLHKDKKYRYAATQVYYKDEQTGKLKHKYTFWGTVTEDLVFIPGPNYKLASKEVRDRLIFPQEWNLDAIQPIAGKDESLNSGEDGLIASDVMKRPCLSTMIKRGIPIT